MAFNARALALSNVPGRSRVDGDGPSACISRLYPALLTQTLYPA